MMSDKEFLKTAVAMKSKVEEDEEPMTYKDVTYDFADNTNCNGIANAKRANHIVRKLFWTALVLAGAGLTFKLLVDVFTKFFDYPVAINVNVTFESTLTFPAVTICNVNMVRRSKLSLMAGSDALNELTFTSGGNPDISAWATTKGRMELRHEFVDGWSKLEDTTKEEMGHQLEEMLLDCSFNGKHCDQKNFTSFINPKFGNCYMYNSNWENGTVQLSHRPGPFYGLMLELFIEQDEYIPELAESAGIIVTVHDQEVMPFPEDDGILIAPSMQSNVAITVEKIIRKENPYPSDCLNLMLEEAAAYSAYSEIYPVRYTHSACYRTCYQAHLFAECGCGDPVMPLQGKALYNLLTNKTNTIGVCETDDEKACELTVHLQYTDNELECNCSVACEDTVHEMTVHTLKWPANNYKPLYYGHLATRNPHLASIMSAYITNGTDPGLNLVKLSVYFNEFNYKEIEEYASYPSSSLLSDLGGAIGFYLGISVIAVFEFLEYFFDMCLVGCRKKKPTKATQVESLTF